MKPVIGIPGNTLTNENRGYSNFPIAYTPQGFIDGLQAADALPIVFPISNAETAKQYVKSVDAIVLAGGQDVSPLTYGEEPHLKLESTNPDRDYFEMEVIVEAWKEKKPILAICRGLQIVNVVCGGTLYQDLSLYPDHKVQHRQESIPSTAVHSIQIEKETWLGNLYGTKTAVNSYHHQAIKELGDGLKPVAWASDGLIEGFEAEDKERIVIGVQWHPEWMLRKNKEAQEIFTAFVDTVKEWKSS